MQHTNIADDLDELQKLVEPSQQDDKKKKKKRNKKKKEQQHQNPEQLHKDQQNMRHHTPLRDKMNKSL